MFDCGHVWNTSSTWTFSFLDYFFQTFSFLISSYVAVLYEFFLNYKDFIYACYKKIEVIVLIFVTDSSSDDICR